MNKDVNNEFKSIVDQPGCVVQYRNNLQLPGPTQLVNKKKTKQAGTLVYPDANAADLSRPTELSPVAAVPMSTCLKTLPKITDMVGHGHQPAQHVAVGDTVLCHGLTTTWEMLQKL